MMLVLLSMLRLLLPPSLLALLLMLLLLLLLPPLPANAAIELAFSCSANHVRKGACTSSQNCQTRRSSHPPEQTRISIQLQILGLAFGIEGLWVSGSGHTESRRGYVWKTLSHNAVFESFGHVLLREVASTGLLARPKHLKEQEDVTGLRAMPFSACSRHCSSGFIPPITASLHTQQLY